MCCIELFVKKNYINRSWDLFTMKKSSALLSADDISLKVIFTLLSYIKSYEIFIQYSENKKYSSYKNGMASINSSSTRIHLRIFVSDRILLRNNSTEYLELLCGFFYVYFLRNQNLDIKDENILNEFVTQFYQPFF